MYTRVVARPRVYRPRHAVENQWDLVAAIAPELADAPDRERNRVEMPVSEAALQTSRGALAAMGVPETASLVVMHVGAGNPFRRWPEASFATVASVLAAEADDRWILLMAGPAERAAAVRIAAEARTAAPAAAARILVAADLSLAEVRATLDRAALYIGGDTGPMHIASTSDVPIVALFGPTLPERSAPWRPVSRPTIAVEPAEVLACRPCDQRHCVPGDFRCLAAVRPAAVVAAATRLLEGVR